MNNSRSKRTAPPPHVSISRRTALGTLSVLTAGGAVMLSGLARAEDVYPNKPVRIVVPFGAGGVADVIVRIVADKLSESMGQRYFVENKPGAGGSIGTDVVAHAPADGYTMVLGSPSLTVNPSLQKSLGWDPIKDFAPVSMLATFPNIICAKKDLPVKDMKELVELARSQPGNITFGSVGVGTSMHLIGETINSHAKVKMTHVAYKTQGDAIQDLTRGNISWMALSVTLAKPLIAQGTVKPLAVTSAERFKAVPEIPTVVEQGFPDLVVEAWLALYMPAKTPDAIVQRTNKAIEAALKSPDVVAKLDNFGAVPAPDSSQQLATFTKDEVERWAKVVKDANIQPQ